MAHLSLSPPSQAMESPSLAGSSCTCSVAGHDVGTSPMGAEDLAVQKLALDLEGLLIQGEDYSDAVIITEGVSVSVHRCILAARCPFFRTIFSKRAHINQNIEEEKDPSSRSLDKDHYDLSSLVTSGRVGHKVFMVVLNYIYGGKLKGLDDACSVSCMDSACPHKCCWPFVDTQLEILCAASIFDIPELKSFSQQHLLKILDKVQIEHVPQILRGAWTHGATQLMDKSIHTLVCSSIEAITLEKLLPVDFPHKIFTFRLGLGLLPPDVQSEHERQCRKVYMALDSDDIELVELLLKESKLTMDSACALHYAAAYCDGKTISELLDRGMADINYRDRRGLTTLHVATFRRDPKIIGYLLEKGANPLDLTPDGQTALQISKRLTRLLEPNSPAEPREDVLRDKISVEILEQADKINPLSVFPVVGEKELYMRLLYLENRVALARLLFPREAKVVCDLSHVFETREYTGLRRTNMDLNEEPSSSLHSDSESAELPTCMDETLIQRVEALQRAVEVGQRFFPRCVAILNNFMDDGSFEHACIQDRRIPDLHPNKKQRVVENSGIKDIFAEAYRKDVAAMDQKSGKSDLLLTSAMSSSSSSSSPGVVDMCKENPST